MSDKDSRGLGSNSCIVMGVELVKPHLYYLTYHKSPIRVGSDLTIHNITNNNMGLVRNPIVAKLGRGVEESQLKNHSIFGKSRLTPNSEGVE